jgi:hypothetical protein
LFGPTICTRWNGQDRKNKDDLIDHMVNLFCNTFNKKVVTKLADENLKYTRAHYRDKLQLDLKHERPLMVPEKEWKALIEDAKENLFKKQEYIHELVKQGTTHVILLVKYDHLCFYFMF